LFANSPMRCTGGELKEEKGLTLLLLVRANGRPANMVTYNIRPVIGFLCRVFSLAILPVCLVFADVRAIPGEESVYYEKARSVANELTQGAQPYDALLGASTLAELGDVNAYKVIVEYASSADLMVQRAAIDTLISINQPQSLALLMDITADDETLFGYMIGGLAANPREDATDLLYAALANENEAIRIHALKALAEVGHASALHPFWTIARDKHEKLLVRAYAYYGIARLGQGDTTLDQLLEIASSGGTKEKEIVAVSLGAMNTIKSHAVLTELINNDDVRVSIAALVSDVALRNPQSRKQFVKLITQGDPYRASIAAAGLKRVPPDIAMQVTSQIIECCDISSEAALRLMEAWAWIDFDNIEPVLHWGLKHPEADVNLVTLWVIGSRGERKNRSKLTDYLDAENPAIRGMAAWAVVKSK